jgi:hypothetical protein
MAKTMTMLSCSRMDTQKRQGIFGVWESPWFKGEDPADCALAGWGSPLDSRMAGLCACGQSYLFLMSPSRVWPLIYFIL